MKYLIIQKPRWSTNYVIEEFATKAALAAHLLSTDTLAKDAIVAERLAVNISFGEYIAPVEVPEVEAPAIEEVAA